MDIYDRLKGFKSIGVMGLGVSSLGVLRILSALDGVELTVRSDRKTDRSELPGWAAGARILDNERALCEINEDILFLSPSVKRERHELREAEARGTLLTSDAEMFFDTVAGDVLAVSGSSGKSTTCELAHRLLLSGDPEAKKSGNCGKSMLCALDGDNAEMCHIVELSSFMLEYMRPRTRRAVLTGISENHLDWHGSYENYIRAKCNLLENAEERALWYGEGLCQRIADKYRPQILLSDTVGARSLAGVCDIAVTRELDAVCINGAPWLRLDAIKRCEPYNVRNFMSAVALCLGRFERDALEAVARGFDGIEHRCHSLGIFGGIEYIDSSIDSTPERTVQTLTGLGGRVVLILGGRGKGLSYLPLCEPVAKYCDAVTLCGENAEQIERALLESAEIRARVPIYSCDDFTEAVTKAKELANGCKRVLLSPASTSYDRFKNFEERAAVFKGIISK